MCQNQHMMQILLNIYLIHLHEMWHEGFYHSHCRIITININNDLYEYNEGKYMFAKV